MKLRKNVLPFNFITLCCAAVLACSITANANEAIADPSEAIASTNNVIVELSTNLGKILIEIDEANAPISSANFLAYVDEGFYDGTVFHRVINNFMIQAGGYDENFRKKKTLPPIKNEAKNGLRNKRGSLAMARTDLPDSATSQFYINLVDNNHLDHSRQSYGYAVFGRVVSGMSVIDKIAVSRTTTRNGLPNVPTSSVIILSAKRKSVGERVID